MNNVILMGRLAKDPDLKYSGEGKAFCNLTIAVSKEFGKEGADFINCVAFSKTAETIGKFFRKGKPILVQGRLQVSSYDNKNGEKVWRTDVIIDKFNFIDSNSDSSSKNEYQNNNYSQSPQTNNISNDNNDYIEEDDEEFPF